MPPFAREVDETFFLHQLDEFFAVFTLFLCDMCAVGECGVVVFVKTRAVVEVFAFVVAQCHVDGAAGLVSAHAAFRVVSLKLSEFHGLVTADFRILGSDLCYHAFERLAHLDTRTESLVNLEIHAFRKSVGDAIKLEEDLFSDEVWVFERLIVEDDMTVWQEVDERVEVLVHVHLAHVAA